MNKHTISLSLSLWLVVRRSCSAAAAGAVECESIDQSRASESPLRVVLLRHACPWRLIADRPPRLLPPGCQGVGMNSRTRTSRTIRVTRTVHDVARRAFLANRQLLRRLNRSVPPNEGVASLQPASPAPSLLPPADQEADAQRQQDGSQQACQSQLLRLQRGRLVRATRGGLGMGSHDWRVNVVGGRFLRRSCLSRRGLRQSACRRRR